MRNESDLVVDVSNLNRPDSSTRNPVFYTWRQEQQKFSIFQYLRRETMIEDETGKTMPAIEVFTHGIRYVSE